MGLSILKTPFRAPQANAFCERLVGTIRRDCLDFLIPLNERHLRRILKEWVAYYNRGRPRLSQLSPLRTALVGAPGVAFPGPLPQGITSTGNHLDALWFESRSLRCRV